MPLQRRHVQCFGLYESGFLHEFGYLQSRGLQFREHLHEPRLNPSYTKKSNCQNHGGTWTVNTWTSYNGIWTVTGTWTPKVHNATTWNGCVTDRGNEDDPDLTYNFDTNASPPDPVTPRWSSLYAAEQYSSCP